MFIENASSAIGKRCVPSTGGWGAEDSGYEQSDDAKESILSGCCVAIA